MNKPKLTITAEEAFALITRGENIYNCSINGTLFLGESEFNYPVVLENCEVENLKAGSVQFNAVVKFTNCHFSKCDFPFCYFRGGLEIRSCLFDAYLDFQCGGHNNPANSFLISGTVFKEFVNFFDCIYEGPVMITFNRFEKGTNLLGNRNESYATSFKGLVTVEGNEGGLNIDGEGGDEEMPPPKLFPINLN